MPAFLLEEVAYSPSHILSTPLYIPQNILENMRIFPSIISHTHPRGAKKERFKAKNWLPSAILLELFARTPTRSCPRCQHSYSGTTSATKPPKRRNMPGICGMKPSPTLEYHHIPDWSARTVPQDPLYSREYSGIRSCQTPPIFQKIFRNIWQTKAKSPG